MTMSSLTVVSLITIQNAIVGAGSEVAGNVEWEGGSYLAVRAQGEARSAISM